MCIILSAFFKWVCVRLYARWWSCIYINFSVDVTFSCCWWWLICCHLFQTLRHTHFWLSRRKHWRHHRIHHNSLESMKYNHIHTLLQTKFKQKKQNIVTNIFNEIDKIHRNNNNNEKPSAKKCQRKKFHWQNPFWIGLHTGMNCIGPGVIRIWNSYLAHFQCDNVRAWFQHLFCVLCKKWHHYNRVSLNR